MVNSEIKQGSLFGAILLVAGCCIGAGMLGLPVLTGLAGFKPSLFMFVLSWLFMLATGFLVLEVNLLFKNDVNIVSMAQRTLGTPGKIAAWVIFFFLFYCLMVAYSAASGELCSNLFQEMTGSPLPHWVGGFFMIFLFAFLIYIGTQAVDQVNRVFVYGLIFTYILLVSIGASHVNLSYLKHQDWSASLLVLPAMIISFGYHNLIPSLSNYLNHDANRLRWTIAIGSSIPLIIYLLWEFVLLGLIPVDGENGFRTALSQGDLTTTTLKYVVGSNYIVDIAHYFALFAIITSFLAVALSFVDFLSDGLQIKKTSKGAAFLCVLALLPPFLFSLFYPKLFLTALNYAGGFGAIILFGLMPALMVWSARYIKKYNPARMLPGGKPMLILIIICSLLVLGLQLTHELKG